MLMRLRDFAAMHGVCKKTAKRMAEKDALPLEKRPVRGGWAWFVDAPADAPREQEKAIVDIDRLQQCLSVGIEAHSLGLPLHKAAELVAAIYSGRSL